ncbi:MAG: molybdopterin molybdotransferase MoeA [Gammaproteobacteria bacterium]|nr:molybdopterin molybdotransferase MoeA [Gammaproteobacteria bacterium]MYL00975.1 molybdopterin molybdotransferase MoeA [Gammaproteobacteria bacterium]
MQTELTVAQADRLIRETVAAWPAETVALDAAAGRVLRQNVLAERDLPPYDRATMDGIAMRWRAWSAGQREFPLEGMQSAGQAPGALSNAGAAWRIATGAPLPQGADTIVPVERLSETNGGVRIDDDYRPKRGQFIHTRGSDRRAGALLLKEGQRIGGVEMALLSANGVARPRVAPDPPIALVSTGDELVGLDSRPESWQVRSSNGPAMSALLKRHGFGKVTAAHAPDDPDVLAQRIRKTLSDSDALILSGGVSKGAKDYVPGVLTELGARPVFHRIRQRPGFPLWFGMHAEKPIFGLPGNPVSSLVCLRRYVIPALKMAQGAQAAAPEHATLSDEVSFKPSLTWFLPVRLSTDRDGRLLARPRQTNTSGDFASLARTDGFAQLPANRTRFPAGYVARIFRWHN